MLVMHSGEQDTGELCGELGQETAIEAHLAEHFVHVHMPLCGGARLLCPEGERALNAELAGVISPGSPCRVVWDRDCEQLIVRIAGERLEKVGRGIVGGNYRAPIVFEPEMNLQTPGGRAWRLLVDYARGEDAMRNPTTPSFGHYTLEDLLIAHLLVHQRHNYTDGLLDALPESPSRS
ncbi:cupin domain-containing protein [Pigmentiphaga litoralis]|uniref:cupin domain-containing protein n=1 Tax=Pigmentiphaga litoralis TaxID=516702 RepID=UPI00359C664C